MTTDSSDDQPGFRPPMAVVAVALVLLYIVSPAPLALILKACGHTDYSGNGALDTIVRGVYYPLKLAYEKIPGVAEFYQWQGRMFGVPL